MRKSQLSILTKSCSSGEESSNGSLVRLPPCHTKCTVTAKTRWATVTKAEINKQSTQHNPQSSASCSRESLPGIADCDANPESSTWKRSPAFFPHIKVITESAAANRKQPGQVQPDKWTQTGWNRLLHAPTTLPTEQTKHATQRWKPGQYVPLQAKNTAPRKPGM